MYSVVLMMALSQSATLPERHGCGGGRGGCHGGCHGGGYGGGWGGCYGGGWGGGYGGGWGGCYGGGWGGGYGGGWGGCYGGGFGYGGGLISTGYYGGGYGGCFGGGLISGGGYGGGVISGGVISGGCAGGSVLGGVGGVGGTYMTPIQSGTIQGGEKIHHPHDGKKQSQGPAPATIVVSLPEDATLTIDDNPTSETSGQRVFVSPELEQGQDYHYTLKATVQRDGKPVVIEKRIAVHAGETTPVTLSLPETGVAQR